MPLRRRLLCLTVAPLLLSAGQVAADADDTFSLIAAGTVMHDDNLFRLPANANTQALLGKSTRAEDITITALTLRVNKPYSLQRFEFEASLLDYRYTNFSYLSYSAKPYKGAWHWSLTPYLHGNLSSDYSESLNSFADFTGYTVRNTNSRKNTRFDAVADLSASWHLLGGVSESTNTNSQAVLGEGDSRLKLAEAGLRYTFASGSTLSYIAKTGRGDYIKRAQPIAAGLFDNRFDDTENEVRLLWSLTGKTSIDARIAHIERKHAHYAARDYAGNVGNLNLNWAITGKTSLTAGYTRELSSYQTASNNYSTIDRFTLTPLWQFSGKTALRAKFDYAQRECPAILTAVPASRSDTLRTALIAVDWQPLRSATVSASLQNDKRASNQPGLDYESNTLGVTAQLTF